MELKELIDFMQWTTGEGKYNYTIEFSKKEQQFAQMIKLGEEYGELCEQVSGALGAHKNRESGSFFSRILRRGICGCYTCNNSFSVFDGY